MENWEARIVFKPGQTTQGVYISRKHSSGGREYLKSGEMVETVAPGMAPKDDPYFALLDEDQLKALQVAISEFGIKPPEASYIEGKLEATEKHLEDMRSIVGHVKKIPLKGGLA